MGLPVENYKGYVEADATQKAKNIESDTFFLIHGLADATAPYHHGVQLARSLTEAGTIFRYTVRRHEKGFTLSKMIIAEKIILYFSRMPTRVTI
jgi:dipeptidyl aminopeptidase/acylaminoacyl peptidase